MSSLEHRYYFVAFAKHSLIHCDVSNQCVSVEEYECLSFLLRPLSKQGRSHHFRTVAFDCVVVRSVLYPFDRNNYGNIISLVDSYRYCCLFKCDMKKDRFCLVNI